MSKVQQEFLPFAKPLIEQDEIDAVVECLTSGWLTTGPKTRQFEEAFAEFVGAEHAIAVNSATAGLHLAVESIGVGPGDKVITTPFTFTASAEVIRYMGADPLLVDIDPNTLNIDPNRVADTVRSNDDVKAIMPVHFAGQAVDMDPILGIAKESGCRIVEDAAHALPTTYKDQTIGSIGDASVFSFYVTKTITTGEGGMVTTDDAAMADRMRTMRLHGISRDVFDRYTSKKPSWHYEVVAPGYKYNMSDIAAALGLQQLAKAERFRRAREAIAKRYSDAFGSLPVTLPSQDRADDTHSWHLYVLRLRLDELSINRDRFIELMADAGIGTSVHFIPLHMHPYWRDRYQLSDDDFPNASQAYHQVVSLPLYPQMTDADIDRVIDAVSAICTKYSK
ncbi:MAG: DegT/DnrJ/EryC1/StrS aminotransferase family protein [Pseudomonadota bacterium]